MKLSIVTENLSLKLVALVLAIVTYYAFKPSASSHAEKKHDTSIIQPQP